MRSRSNTVIRILKMMVWCLIKSNLILKIIVIYSVTIIIIRISVPILIVKTRIIIINIEIRVRIRIWILIWIKICIIRVVVKIRSKVSWIFALIILTDVRSPRLRNINIVRNNINISLYIIDIIYSINIGWRIFVVIYLILIWIFNFCF